MQYYNHLRDTPNSRQGNVNKRLPLARSIYGGRLIQIRWDLGKTSQESDGVEWEAPPDVDENYRRHGIANVPEPVNSKQVRKTNSRQQLIDEAKIGGKA